MMTPKKYLLATIAIVMSMLATISGYAQINTDADNSSTPSKVEATIDNSGTVINTETIIDNSGTTVSIESNIANTGTSTVNKADLIVEAGKTVKLDYTLKVENKVVDSSKGREPLSFKIGEHKVIPGFEKGLLGLKIDEEKTFSVPPEDAYGVENPEAFKEVEKSALPAGQEPKVGQVLYIKGPDGQPYPVRIHEVKDNTVILNFNHPLSGKTLEFTVKIVDIQ